MHRRIVMEDMSFTEAAEEAVDQRRYAKILKKLSQLGYVQPGSSINRFPSYP